MSAHKPSNVARPFFRHSDLPLLAQGKVRDTYQLPNKKLMLVVTNNRVSIFDFILPTLIPGKGEVLNAINIWWRTCTDVLGDTPDDLIAYGRDIENYLPAHLQNRKENMELYKRAVVVQRLDMLPVEAIVRGYLTGSGWRDYRTNGTVYGHRAPEGLHDGDKLPEPVFTPTTKETSGHDEPMSAADVREQYGSEIEDRAKAVFARALEIAHVKELILADTKLEFGRKQDGALTVADEILTPDSSRFWDVIQWKKSVREGNSPPPMDKEIARAWGKDNGIHKLDPENPEDYARVQNMKVPLYAIEKTASIYQELANRLLDAPVNQFQAAYLL